MSVRSAKAKAVSISRSRREESRGERQLSHIVPAQTHDHVDQLVSAGYARTKREAVIRALAEAAERVTQGSTA